MQWSVINFGLIVFAIIIQDHFIKGLPSLITCHQCQFASGCSTTPVSGASSKEICSTALGPYLQVQFTASTSTCLASNCSDYIRSSRNSVLMFYQNNAPCSDVYLTIHSSTEIEFNSCSETSGNTLTTCFGRCMMSASCAFFVLKNDGMCYIDCSCGQACLRKQNNTDFNSYSLTCKPACSTLNQPSSDPRIHVQSLTVGSMAVYYCEADDNYATPAIRECQANGTWSGSNPTCVTRTSSCGSLSAPANGPSPTVTYHRATYSCNSGYTIWPTNARSCQVNGSWTEPVPACQADCSSMTVDAGCTSSTLNQFGDGSYTSIVCSNGTQAFFYCPYSTGQWTTTYMSQSGATCPTLTSPANCLLSVTMTTATYTCNSGYNMASGDATRTCQSNSTWSGTEPVCSPVDCGSVWVQNGSVSYSQLTVYPSVAQYTCNEGFNLTTSISTRTCQPNGTWSLPEPACVPVDCRSVSVQNGSVSYSQLTVYPSVAQYTCDEGFNLTTSISTRTCQPNGTWSLPEPTCVPVDCRSVSVQNGSVSYSQLTVYPSIAQYTCDEGFNLTISISTRLCQTNGTWSTPVPACEPIDCGLVMVQNGSVSYTQLTVYSSVAQYTCDEGFILTTSISTRTCQPNGTWSTPEPTCEPVDCGTISIQNGNVSYSQLTEYASIAEYMCDAGFNLTTSISNRTCQANGTWSTPEPACVPAVNPKATPSPVARLYIMVCRCPTNRSTFSNLSQEAIIEQLIQETAIDTSQTTAAIGKLECRQDPRPSAKTIGTIGVAFLCVIFGTMLIFDCITIYKYITSGGEMKVSKPATKDKIVTA